MTSNMDIHLHKYQFASRVYKTLSMQLGTTILMVLLTMIPFINNRLSVIIIPLFPTMLAAVIAIILVLMYAFENMTIREIYFYLTLFNIASGGLVAITTLIIPSEIVLGTLVGTFTIVMALNYHATYTSYDYSRYYNYLFGLLMCVIGIFLLYLFSDLRLNTLIMGTLNAVLFSGFIVYDTQRLIAEDKEYTFKSNGHIIIALVFYIDIVYLFVMILTIVNYLASNRLKSKYKTNTYQCR
jgi:FtsH-binding integral membrane protein